MARSRWLAANLLLSLFLLLVCSFAFAKSKPQLPTVRWTSGAPSCTFERRDDGKYRWTMSDKDLEINLLVDSQELTKSRGRFYHLLGVYTSVMYKGTGNLEFPADLRIDFVRHHDVIEAAQDPTELQNRLQNDIDTVIFDTEREIKKKPETKDAKTATAREYQKEAAEFIEFLTTQYLVPVILNSGNPETHGWVFFATSNKWIGPWKEHEDFILSIYMKDQIWQFPFSLPPTPGDLILRKPED